MTKKQEIQLFNDRRIRTVWDDKEEKWYFSVVDVIGALTDSADPRNYWKVLKNRLLKEGNETVTNCNQLKLLAADGKMRLTDIADQEQLFRLIQSIPSPETEHIKSWIEGLNRSEQQGKTLSVVTQDVQDKIVSIRGHHVITDAEKQTTKMQKFGEVISDIVMPDLETSETESSLELNFFIGKIKHTVKRVKKSK